MPFMQRQITNRRQWYCIETQQGTFFVDREDVGDFPDADQESVDENVYPLAVEALGQFVEGGPDSIQSWETLLGYGARLSAPGYMDRTEWSVFNTIEEAEDSLKEMYPEEDDSE